MSLTQEQFNAMQLERQAKRRDRDLQDLVSMLRHKELGPRVRRQLWRFMAEAGTFRPSFDPERPHVTSMNEGQRKIGNFILQEVLAAAPETFTQMQREATSQDAEDAKWLEEQKKHLEE